MKRSYSFNKLAFFQLITPPFRVETGVPPEEIPIYAKLPPMIPPYTPYRRMALFPFFSTTNQLRKVLRPANLAFVRGDEHGLGNFS
ncbi:hypothetical protein [Thermoactinomyces sp. CICC 10522]|uniref:hypothetical protein n=1 Tax=Thermoactinomyces sp. CICC 10522 TaxID=2767427 RepID=UPI0018DB30A7|nr:hypothetical protein [Thermoactinomyces sp. CICC 10522]MBH8605881.1 hypothetical protein [Thermoactinomyces sp. CICC 10522]